jgi:hypothetical protein
MTHDDLDDRLAAIEGRVPVEARPPALAESRRRRRSVLALVAAPILVLAIGATAIAGPAVIRIITTSSTGTLDVDDAIAHAGLECMTPPQAARWLSEHGYDRVVWSTDAGHGTISLGPVTSGLPVIDPDPSQPPTDVAPGLPNAGGHPVITETTTPPEAGVVIPGPTIDGVVRIYVDTTPGAERAPTCPAAAMP